MKIRTNIISIGLILLALFIAAIYLIGEKISDVGNDMNNANDLNGQLSHLKREELQRIQSQAGSIKVSMVYLTMVQEAQNVVTYTINLMKVSRKFQVETEMP